MSLSGFDHENVLSLETYRKNGEPVRRPVWFLKEDNLLIVHTSDSTGKAKQIKRNPKVRVAPSKFRGEPKAEYINAKAEILTDKETVDKYYSLIYKKYGLIGSITKFTQRLSRSKAKDIIIFVRP